MRLFITATNTNIGKTHISKVLIKNLNKNKIKTLGCKPIETGVEEIPLDAKELLETSKNGCEDFKNLRIKDINFYTFSLPASPSIAKKCEKISIEVIKNQISKLEKMCDCLIIEGAGGLFVPIEENFFMIDLIKELDCKTLLVTDENLGCINNTLLSQFALEKRKIKHNICVNLRCEDSNYFEISHPFLCSYFEDLIVYPRDEVKLLSVI